MSDAGLRIAIKADITGLAQGFAAAAAQTRAFADTVNAAAAQMANVFAAAGNAARGQGEAARAAAAAANAANAQEVSFEKNAAEQIAQIRRSNLATDLAISKQTLDAKKQELDAEVAAHQITAQQKSDILAQLTRQEEADNEAWLHDDERAQGASLAQRVEDVNKIRELQSQLVLDLAALKRQETQGAKEEDQKQLESWRGVVGEIANAESSLVSDIFSKRQSLAVDLGQIGMRLVESEIANDLRYYTTHLLYNALGLQSDQATEQGGLLVHLLAEAQKTTATTTGVATRTAATASGAAAGKAAALAAGSSTIANDAGQAAAGTYAAVAQIPIIGPFMAPAMAAGAFAAVMAYDSLTSAAGGQWRVPGDEQLTMLHRNEMVLPASLAEGVRGAVSDRSAGTASAGDVNLHYAPTIHAPQPRSLDDMLRDESTTMLAWFGARMRDGSLRGVV